MADLARELDVSVRTLRRYFAKADIVWSPLRRILDDRRAIPRHPTALIHPWM